MPVSPSTDNFTLGKGIVYFDKQNQSTSLYEGERDLGNAPEFVFNISLEKLAHYSARGGLRAKDKEIISEFNPTVSFTLDEINIANMALLTLADTEEVVQAASHASAESILGHPGLRSDLAYRSIGSYILNYDTGTVLFVVGETVSGATGVGVVDLVVGDSTSGYMIINLTTAGFVDDETLTGDIAGDADANGVETWQDGTVLVQDVTDTTTYVAGTDYEIDTSLKDHTIGRIKVISGGAITEGDTLHVSYSYLAATYTLVRALNESLVEGKLRFVSDVPVGTDQEMEIWRCSLTPSGDTAMIGDDWSTLSFTGEILKDATNHPDSPYMNLLIA